MNLSRLVVLLLSTALSLPVFAQDSKEEINKELRFGSSSSDNHLTVQNINGSISIEGYSGNSIQVIATKEIHGDNSAGLKKGKEEIQLRFAERGNKVFVYLETPMNQYDVEKGKYKSWEENRKYEKPDYRYLVDISIRVPRNSNLKVNTMNDGDVLIKDVQAKDLHVSNLNGAINMENVAGKTYVNALNKDITISYASNPTEESVFKSLNGDIRVNLASAINADVTFKTLNGDFYTDMETEMVPQKMSQSKKEYGKGTKYKLSKNEIFRIGNGGVKLHFDLLNGDVMLKK